MQVAELEESLGTPLFDRLPRGVRLTDAGQTCSATPGASPRWKREAERAMRELRGLERGRLALGASTTIGGYLLPAVLGEFRRRHPGIELQLAIANTESIKTRLIDGTLDLGLTEGDATGGRRSEHAGFQRGRTDRHRPARHPFAAKAPGKERPKPSPFGSFARNR